MIFFSNWSRLYTVNPFVTATFGGDRDCADEMVMSWKD